MDERPSVDLQWRVPLDPPPAYTFGLRVAIDHERQTMAWRAGWAEGPFAHLQDLATGNEHEDTPERVVGEAPEDPESVAPTAWAYYWEKCHSPAFMGGPGSTVYWKDVTAANACTIYRYHSQYFGRELTGPRCGGGALIWRIKLRAWVANP